MNTKTAVLALVILALCSAFAFADELQYNYYFEVNESSPIRLVTNTTGVNASLDINGSVYQMTDGADYFSISLSNPIKDDVPFYVYKYNYTNYTVGNVSYNNITILNNLTGTMRFRIPFNVQVQIFKKGSTRGNATVPFKDDFQYVYIQKITGEKVSSASQIKMSTGWFNSAIGLTPKTLDTKLSLWGDYSDGSATIKVYESGNYSLNLETTKTKSSIPWAYEFYYPQSLGAHYSQNIANLEIPTEQAQDFKVYATAYEIDSAKMLMNLVYTVIIVLVFFALIYVSILTGNGYLILTVVFGGGLIVISLIHGL
jgi:hypothetical protein